MLAKTDKGREIRKYYVKLENAYNEILKQEFKEQEENTKKLLQEQEENAKKLLQEKDKYIAQLKDQEYVSILYIAHNPMIKNVHKIGISSHTKTNGIFVRHENHKSSNPQFEFLFTFETPNAKLIEDLVKLLLKSFRLSKPEWFNITYERMKQVVDFVIMMYENYQVNDSVDNLIEFISRYRSNRLINTNKARIIIEKNIYEKYIKENIIYGEQLKVSTELLSNDFYEWYKSNFPDKIDLTHIKLYSGNWSTEFQKELTKTISNITQLDYTTKLSLSDRKRGIYFSNSSGFIGIELKSMIKKADFFDKSIYKKYVTDFITITNNPRHKVARKEILDDFLVWVKNNNFVCKNKIICRTAISSVFKDVLIENLENITGLKIQDVCKINFSGCFIGMTHTKFPFLGNETTPRESLTDLEKIKKQIDSWCNQDNTTIIAKIFKIAIKNNNIISKKDVKELMYPNYVDLCNNKRKQKWHLVFKRRDENFIINKESIEYYSSLNIVKFK